jgi:hypothetical protein
MKALNDAERHLADSAARLIATAAEIGLPDAPRELGVSPQALQFLAHSFVEQRDQIRALHDLVDQTDPNDPVGAALTKVGLARRP